MKEIKFRIWMYTQGLKDLVEHPNREFLNNLYGKVTSFSKSELFRKEASVAQELELNQVKAELEALGAELK